MKTLRNVLMAAIFVMVAFAVAVPRAEAAFDIKISTVGNLLGSNGGLYDYDNANFFKTYSFTYNGSPDTRVLIVGYSRFPDDSILPNIYGVTMSDGSDFKFTVYGKGSESYTIDEMRVYVDTNGNGIWGGLNGDGSITPDPGDELYGGNTISISGGPIGYISSGYYSVTLDSVAVATSEFDCYNDSDCVDDDVYCNGSPVCSSGECVAGTDPCNDDETCDEASGSCLECSYDSDCDNSDFCDGFEECFVGSCVAGAEPCDNDQTCNEGSDTCVDIVDPDCLNDSDCSDDSFCNGAEQCVSGECVDGDDPCDNDQTCDEGSNICVDIFDPDCDDNSDCDDGLYCNGIETCSSGVCASGSAPCSVELCNEGSDTCDDCVTNDDCDDGLYCNGDETCSDGECASGSAPCYENETCEEASDQCLPEACDLEWDLDDDCDVDKDDAKLLKLQQKAEKTVLKIKHKAEKNAIKAALQ